MKKQPLPPEPPKLTQCPKCAQRQILQNVIHGQWRRMCAWCLWSEVVE